MYKADGIVRTAVFIRHALLRLFALVFRVSRFLFHDTAVHHSKLAKWTYESIISRLIGRGRSENTMLVRYRNVSLLVPSADIAITPGLVTGVYEARELDLFLQAVKLETTFIDVGSNCGLWTVLAAKSPNVSKVYAFEPHPVLCQIIAENTQLNDLKNVTVVSSAVGRQTGKAYLVANKSPASGTISQEPTRTSIAVQQTTLDEYFSSIEIENLAVKIDCEGLEPLVIAGMTTLIKQFKPLLAVEINLAAVDIGIAEWRDVIHLLDSTYQSGVEVTARHIRPFSSVGVELLNIIVSNRYANVILYP